MPRQEIDYFKTVIYKIVCIDLEIGDCYVGSTTDFRKRKNQHKTHCGTKNLKLYQFINSNGGWDNWDMIEIEKFPCMDSNEQRRRERYWIEELKAELNIRRAITTIEEDKIKNRNNCKKYNIINAEKLKLYRHEYYLKHK